MRIFGWTLSKDRAVELKDTDYELVPKTRDAKPRHQSFRCRLDDALKSRTTPVEPTSLVGVQGGFFKPVFDFRLIKQAERVEPLVKRSISKHCRSIMKQGFKLVGKNTKYVDQLYEELDRLAQATGQTTLSIITRLVGDATRFSNPYLILQRGEVKTPYSRIKFRGKDTLPIEGLFVADPSLMSAKVDKFGNVTRWMLGSGSNSKEFNPDNIVHIPIDVPSGEIFGTPYLEPALDDIRFLHRMEESTEAMVNNAAVPFLKYTIGNKEYPQATSTDKGSEVDKVFSALKASSHFDRLMVLPWFHDIKAIVDPNVANQHELLKYVFNRVMASLHLTTMDIGVGDTATRSTAQSMEQGFIEQCKGIQSALSDSLSFMLFDQLLAFKNGGKVPPRDERVHLVFPEIDFLTTQVQETHALGLYQGNVITIDEVRESLGREPLSEGDRKNLHLEIVQKELAKTKAETSASANATATKSKPKNQYGTKPGKTPTKNSLIDDLIDAVAYADFHANENIDAISNIVLTRVHKVLESFDMPPDIGEPGNWDNGILGILEKYTTLSQYDLQTEISDLVDSMWRG